MPQVSVTRRYRFSASHRLHSSLFNDQQNLAAYGKCNNPFGHGHDYTLEVTVAGEPDPLSGRLVPLSRLDHYVQSGVLDGMAWRNLNADVPEFASLVPTTENLAGVIAARLSSAWHVAFPERVRFERIRIHETRNNIFEAEAPCVPRPASPERSAQLQQSR